MKQFKVKLTIMRIVCNFLAKIEPTTNGNFTIVEMKYTGSCGHVIHTALLLDKHSTPRPRHKYEIKS